MKKHLFLIATLTVFGAVMAFAQPRAIGARFGYNADFVYQHQLGEKNFIELNAGVLDWWNGVHVDFLHEWIWLTPDWTPKGEWNWFAGVGADGGWRWYDNHIISDGIYTGGWAWSDDVATAVEARPIYHTQAFIAGVKANIGLEYNFWFPLSLAVDYRPTFGLAFGKYAGTHLNNNGDVVPMRFYMGGLFDGALSVRYKF